MSYIYGLAQLVKLFLSYITAQKLSVSVCMCACVCVCVNQSGPNRDRDTWRLVILYGNTHSRPADISPRKIPWHFPQTSQWTTWEIN